MSGSKERLKHVERATVTVVGKQGQGVLVPGELILTAAHCVTWDGDGQMPLGDVYEEEIRTADGSALRVSLVAVEPVADIAVLSSHGSYQPSLAFSEFCENTEPVRLYFDMPRFQKPIPVAVRSHRQKWLAGKVTRWGVGPSSTLGLETEEDIEGGTSGGPVVTETGELLGVVSTAGGIDGSGTRQGQIPWAAFALPFWVRELIRDPETATLIRDPDAFKQFEERVKRMPKTD